MNSRDSVIVSKYLKGEAGTAIAKEFGMNRTSIYRILRKNGVEVRKVGGVSGRPGSLSISSRIKANREVVRKLRSEGKTYAEIGEELGVTRQRAHQLFNDHRFE